MIESIVRELRGRRLEKAIATYHVYEGHYSRDPMDLWLGFEGAPQRRFAGASDGWHLVVDDLSPQEIEMQESGSVLIRDVGGEPPFSQALNQRVRRGWMITSPSPDDIVGVRFDFDTVKIWVLNWGDELYIGSGLPSDANLKEMGERPIY